ALSGASAPAPAPAVVPDLSHDTRGALERTPRHLTLWALAAGALAGVAAWLAWESVSGYFAPRSEIVHILGRDQSIITPEGQIRAGVGGGSVATAILGAALGLSLGFVGGWVRRSVRAGLGAGLAGAVLGALGGWGVARVLLPVFYDNE